MTIDYCGIINTFLEKIKAGRVPARDVGICMNFVNFCASRRLPYHEIYYAKETLKSMMRNFPKYTGDPVYPLVPQDEYDTHQRARVDFYDPTTPYGALRHEFVEWSLNELAQKEASYMKR